MYPNAVLTKLLNIWLVKIMFTEQMKLPTVSEVLQLGPLSDELKTRKQQFDAQIKDNFVSRSRFTVVCGPCSADDPEAMREYLGKLSDMQISHPNLLIVARVYTSKPHSNGQGYKGTCFHVREKDDIDLRQGIVRARKIMLDCLRLGLPVADELLYPELYRYFADLVSYWFVGARSSEDALHRSFASGLDVICGVKNGTDGDILKVVDSLNAVSKPCVFPFEGAQIATSGCKYAHVVLRGGKLGDSFTANISQEHTQLVKKRLMSLGLNDYIMADLSHYNSGKVASRQIENAELVAGNPDINGVMLESYIHGGVSADSYGVSQTDDCLNFDDTVKLLDILDQGFLSR